MKNHSRIIDISQPPSSHAGRKDWNAARTEGAALAQQLVSDVLEVVPAPVVARRLGVSPELVYGWRYGRSALALGDVLAGPRPFARRLLVLAGEHLDLVALAASDPREAVALLLCTLGGLLVTSKRPLEQLSDKDLEQAIEDSRAAQQQAGDLARVYEAERSRRGDQPRESKGGPR